MDEKKSRKEELRVLQKAKQLSEEIFVITEKSPQKYRFTLVQRMQNVSLEIITNIYLANDTQVITRFIKDIDKSIETAEKRLSLEKSTPTNNENKLFLERKVYELKLIRASQLSRNVGKRLDYSYEALSKTKLLSYLVELATKNGCITEKQNRKLSSTLFDLRNLMTAFINSDKRRFGE